MRGLALVWLIGCGGSSGGGGDGGGGGGDGLMPDTGVTPTRFGSVFVQSYLAQTQGGSAIATFQTESGPCTRQMTGACEIDDCTSTTPTLVSAGTVAISGTQPAISMPIQPDKTYHQVTSTTPFFAGGESLMFSAAGADVPAFSKTLTAPGKATITAPAKPGTVLGVNRGQDFVVTWTGGGAGEVQVALLPGGSNTVSVYCRFPAAAGTGTIPSATLAHLAGGSGAFAMASVAATTQAAGEWNVHLEAYYNANWPDNTIVSGPTQVQ